MSKNKLCMSILEYAKCELENNSMMDKNNDAINNSVISAIKSFEKNGLCDNPRSLSIAISNFNRLINRKPLTPVRSINEAPDEWVQVANCEAKVFINARYPDIYFYTKLNQYIDWGKISFRINPSGYSFTQPLISDDAAKCYLAELKMLGLQRYKLNNEVKMPYYPINDNETYVDISDYELKLYESYDIAYAAAKKHDGEFHGHGLGDLIGIRPFWIPLNENTAYIGFELAINPYDSIDSHVIFKIIGMQIDKYDDDDDLSWDITSQKIIKTESSIFYMKYIANDAIYNSGKYEMYFVNSNEFPSNTSNEQTWFIILNSAIHHDTDNKINLCDSNDHSSAITYVKNAYDSVKVCAREVTYNSELITMEMLNEHPDLMCEVSNNKMSLKSSN